MRDLFTPPLHTAHSHLLFLLPALLGVTFWLIDLCYLGERAYPESSLANALARMGNLTTEFGSGQDYFFFEMPRMLSNLSVSRNIYILYVCVCSVWVPCVALPFGGGSFAGTSPLCGSPVGGVLPCRVPVSRGICSSSCLSLALTLSQSKSIDLDL